MAESIGILQRLTRATDGLNLALFRFFFGGLLGIAFFEKLVLKSQLFDRFIAPTYHVKFNLFYVPTFSAGIKTWICVAFIIASFLFAFGIFYRLSAAVMLGTYSYFFLVSKNLYNNHYYLVILLLVLFLVTDADCDLTFSPPKLIPAWHVMIFQFQLFIVYFYGGLTKLLYPDWLKGTTMDAIFAKLNYHFVFSTLFSDTLIRHFFTYGGMVFDLIVIPLLLIKRTRMAAAAGLIFFHLFNKLILFSGLTKTSIGVFPMLGIFSLLLFFSGTEIRSFCAETIQKIGRYMKSAQTSSKLARATWPKHLAFAIGIGFLGVQIYLPVQHWITHGIDGPYKFQRTTSWVQRYNISQLQLFLVDKASGEMIQYNLNNELISPQLNKLALDPYSLVQYSKSLKRVYAREHHDIEVRATLLVRSPSSSEYFPAIGPDQDIASLKSSQISEVFTVK